MRKRPRRVRVQLLAYSDCPDAESARQALRRALAEEGLPTDFEDTDLTAPGTPEDLRAWGSPTILVGGKDVAGEEPAGSACRLYPAPEGGVQGSPPDEMIRQAIVAALPARRDWPRSLASIPGVVSSVLPIAT